MADPITQTSNGLFRVETRQVEGRPVEMWTLQQSHWAQYPYFELHNATADQAQMVEDLLRGLNRDTNQIVDPATSLFGRFLTQQRGVTPLDYLYERDPLEGPKTHEPAARGAYLLIDFISQRERLTGGDTSHSEDQSQSVTGQPFDKLIKDVDREEPDFVMRVNSMAVDEIKLKRGQSIASITTNQMPWKNAWDIPQRLYNENGIRDWRAAQAINLAHEIGHALMVEGELAAGASGHTRAWQSLLTGTGTNFDVQRADVQADPVENFAFQVAKQQGLIVDESKYWKAREQAYQQKLDLLIKEKGITTREQLIAFIEAEAARLRPKDSFLPTGESNAFRYLTSVIADSAFRLDISDLAGVFGSTLGRVIAGDDPLAQIAVSSTLSSVLTNLGEVLERPGGVSGGAAQGGGVGEALKEAFGQDLLNTLQGQAIGAVSSYLVGELTQSLGLEGAVGEVANSVGSRVVSQIATNLVNQQPWYTGINTGLFVNAIGSWIGGRLAMEVGNFDTKSGQIGFAIGQAYGGINAALMLAQNPWLLSNPILAVAAVVIVVFLDALLGGFIGSLFSGGTPRSRADLAWDANERQFGVTSVWSKHGGSKDAARSFATTIAEFLNGVVEATGSKLGDPRGIRIGAYGMYKKDFAYYATAGAGAGSITFRTRDANQLINHGAAIAISDMTSRLIGGNVYVKRALAATLAAANGAPGQNYGGAAGNFDVNTLMGNVQTAKDYASYLDNRATIESLIAMHPESAFAAGWLVTLARALELGLHKRGVTDWNGGWTALLDEVLDGKIDGFAFSPANVRLELDAGTNERLLGFVDAQGELLGVIEDTIDSSAKDIIRGTAAHDIINVAGDRIVNTAGLTIDGAVSSGGQHIIDVAAVIDAGGGDDTIVGGDLGNDLIGGDGNDTLVGGKLDDWLFGSAGNDRLFAGAASYSFTDGDAAATAAAINVVSNGDMLDGGDGDDFIYGSRGSDWLRGGAGVDTIHGGAGGDVIDGGTGNDSGPGQAARLFGGGGTDQYIFGYGDGVDVIFDESDNASGPGATGDSLYNRLRGIDLGSLRRNWAGGGDYEIDGSVKGGEDAIAFGVGIGFQDLVLQRSGTDAAPGQDLIIRLTAINPANGQRTLTGDELIIKDWFETTRRVEWLRFADGQDIRIGDVSSFIVGTSGSDVIIGTYGADFIVGGAGNDTIRGLNGDDFGFGGLGKDLVAGDEDNDLVSGGDDDDKVIGALGNDTVFGDAGNDDVYGGAGSDIVVGGRGDDRVIGGAGDDIFRYQRGDGRDELIDDFVSNWELVWQAGGYVNGYALNQSTGVVTKDGVVVFDGSQWIGQYDFFDAVQTFYRHLGPVGGAIAADVGTDYLEFGIGIDIQDLMLSRVGNDLQIAIGSGDSDARAFNDIADRITIRDWYLTGNSIENVVFAATGRHDISGWSLAGAGTEGADTIAGTTGIDWITGNGGDDVITGDAGADILSGNGGADLIRGGADNDVLFGGDADDVLEGNAGADELIGGTGIDIASYATSTAGMRAFLNAPGTNSRDGIGDTYTSIEGLEGTTGADRLGGDGNGNVLRGIGGNDTLYGGAGDDIYEIDATNGQDTILDAPFITDEVVTTAGVFGSAQYTTQWTYLGFLTTASGDRHCYRLVVTHTATGAEVYRSRDQVDFLYTTGATRPLPAASSWPSANGQWLNGAARTGNGTQVAREVLQSGDGGVDTIELGANIGLSDLSFQRLNGGADLRITYATSNYVTIMGQNDVNRAIESLQLRDGLTSDLTRLVLIGETASSEGDLVVGDATANSLSGLAGDDILSGAAGNDTLLGGEGDDVLEGGAGGDTLDGGNDSITAGAVPSAADQTRPYGDTIRYVRSNAAVNIDLAARTASGGHAAGDVIVAAAGVASVENVVGSEGYGDTLRGDARANRLIGLGGNDILEGRAGADVLVGGVGDDTLRGGDGEDNIAGEDGVDTLEGGNDKDILAGGAGNDTMYGDAGADVLSGGDGDDTLRGGLDADRLGGDAGSDQLYGEAGNDQLAGGAGNDALYGGDGDDVLAGEAGNDQLAGDAGNDTYVFDASSGADVIVDAAGTNRIAITDVSVERLWLTRSGDDLRIGVIGGTTTITVQNYYAATNPTRIREIALPEHSLFLAHAQPLVEAMTAQSATQTPASMSTAIADQLRTYWHVGGQARPVATDQQLNTNEDTPLTGSPAAVDHDENITGYALDAAPGRGAVSINATTGAWTYTPGANLYGQDSFNIRITDADNNTVVQTVTVSVASVNDAPSDIALAGAPAGIEERDHPPAGTLLNAIVLGTLSATDVDYPDAGDFASHVYSVTDPRFEIVNGNVLQLRAGVALDFEATPTVSVAVTVTDRNGAGLSFTRNFTFSVLDRDDYFYGTVGNDTLTGQAGRNLMYGYGGNDTLTGANANDDIEGGDGADQLSGLGGNDVLLGGLGDDVINGGTGTDTLRGGDGTDTVRGGDEVDQLFGDGGNDLLQAEAGDDQLDGGADNDRLDGGTGADRLVGGLGDDVLIGGAGADRFLGGSGIDTVSYETATSGVTVNLTTTTGSTGDAAGDVFEDTPEWLIGSAHADTITGSSADDTLEGRAGNDVIYGGAGNDLLLGGDGNDTLDAQSGNDTLNGGIGSDVLIGGADSDTYLLDVDAGADEIRNFDPNGTDIDVVGYQDITHRQLWFERSGNDLIVSVIGTSVRTTVKDWYLVTTAGDRSNYKIDFFLAGEHVSRTINAEALVTLMADPAYPRPTTQAQYDALHANTAFATAWNAAWNPNAPPLVPVIADQTINEDGSVTLTVNITDDYTPAAGLTVTAQAVRVDNHAIEDLSIVNAPTLGAPNAAGDRTLNVTTRPNAAGQVAIRVRAVDAGGLVTERVFLLTVNPVADTPTVTVAQAATPTTPLTQPTLDSGWWSLNVQAALIDQDGSETLEVRIANVPVGLSFTNAGGQAVGTNLGSGVWSFTTAQLARLRIAGPASWSQDLALSITAISRETATGQTATSAATPLTIVINARPTDIAADRTLAFNENYAAGTGLAWFLRTDGDAGDTATYELLNNAGGRFTLRSDGLLSTGSTMLDYEAATSHAIQVRVTDSGGLSRVEDFVVNVNNVNEVPTDLWADRTLGFYENTATWTGIAWFAASDPESNVTSYSLVNDAGGRFYMYSNGLLATGGTPLNYEAGTGHWITVRATDAGGLYRDESFWVDVYNVNESPWVNSTSFTVYEGTHGGPGSYLTTTGGAYALVTGGDPEGATLSYQLVGGDTSAFSIDSAGYLRIQGVLDYESRQSYSVTVRAWDGGGIGYGNYVDSVVPITVANVNEGPKITAINGVNYFRSSNGEVIRYSVAFTAIDPELHAIASASVVSGVGTVTLGDAVFTSVTDTGTLVTDGPGTYVMRLTDQFGISQNTTIQIISRTDVRIVGPIVLDLDDSGVQLTSLAASNVLFDMDNDGELERTGWLAGGDALLALDRNGDGLIAQGAEISFIDDTPGATSDLEGLTSYDTDQDGYFDSDDERYASFTVWQDANSDGVTQAGEMRSLAEHGIKAISLTRTLTGSSTENATDNVITATSEFIRDDGSQGTVGDVMLAHESLELQVEILGSTPVRGDHERAHHDRDIGADGRTHGVDTDRSSIDDIDRSSNGAPPGSLSRGRSNARNNDLPVARAKPVDDDAVTEFATVPAASNSTAADESSQPTRSKPWRWSDFNQQSDANAAAESQIIVNPGAQAGALHASLGSITRRRLQMIEAMASFSPEGAADLSLQPHRKVDVRTLELLTSVPTLRMM